MSILESLGDYFTKNGGLNTVTGALIPAGVQALTTTDPALANVVVSAFTPEVATGLLSGGLGTIVALAIVALRVLIGVKRLSGDKPTV